MLVEDMAMRLYCDGCDDLFETGEGYTAFSGDKDGSEILSDALDSGWKRFNGKHYCPNCYWMDEDNEDIIHTKDGRMYDDVTGLEVKRVIPN